MTATLVVSTMQQGGHAEARWSILLRIRPDRGRAMDRKLSARSPESIPVPTGGGTVDAIFASGRTATYPYTAQEGETVSIQVDVPAPRYTWMRSLAPSRDVSVVRARPEPASVTWSEAARQARVSAAFEVDALAGPALPPLPPAPVTAQVAPPVEVATILRAGATTVQTLSDDVLEEGRLLHLLDVRTPDAMRQPGGSWLALLRLTHPHAPGSVRVCALPGPLGFDRPAEARQAHAALRPLVGDSLPDVQLTPADCDVAAVVGFLERGDQRALAVLREDVVGWAVHAMEEKGADPIVAAIALAVLIRLAALDAVRGWSRNLWRSFPGLPDGAALHAAVLLQESATDVAAWMTELRCAVLDAAGAGLPMLADSLRHLRNALAELGQPDAPDAELEAARAWCNRMVRVMDADAVFTTVTLDAKELGRVWGFRAQGGAP